MKSKSIEVATGKAATRVSDDQLAINVGSDMGVQLGDSVVVRRTVVINDPDTDLQLGIVHLSRLRLKVTLVSASFSVATVTELVPSSTTVANVLQSTRVRRSKTIATRESAADETSVYVEPGEPIVVSRTVEVPEPGEDD